MTMAIETIEALIEGGKATAAPPLGPALGPLGVNIGQIIADINNKTADFKGMQVPVKVDIDTDTKQHTITVGTPPASQLILKEAKVDGGSGVPNRDYVADLKIEQIIKVAKMKQDALLGKTRKERVKEILGTCQSMGIMVEGKVAHETIDDVNAGMYDKKIESGKTELTEKELNEQEEERKKLQQEIEERRDEFLEQAQGVLDSMPDAELSEIKGELSRLGIPAEIQEEVLPSATPAVENVDAAAKSDDEGEK